MKKQIAATLSIAVALGGCATSSKDVASKYTSPLQYNAYDCNQLSIESARIQGRISELGGRLDEAAANDKKITGLGVILFWPALFALGGTKEQEAEYGRLKGDYEAVQQSAIAKNCAIAPPPTQATPKQPTTEEKRPDPTS